MEKFPSGLVESFRNINKFNSNSLLSEARFVVQAKCVAMSGLLYQNLLHVVAGLSLRPRLARKESGLQGVELNNSVHCEVVRTEKICLTETLGLGGELQPILGEGAALLDVARCGGEFPLYCGGDTASVGTPLGQGWTLLARLTAAVSPHLSLYLQWASPHYVEILQTSTSTVEGENLELDILFIHHRNLQLQLLYRSRWLRVLPPVLQRSGEHILPVSI